MEQVVVEKKALRKRALIKRSLRSILWLSVFILLAYSYIRSEDVEENRFDTFETFDSYEKLTDNPLVYEVFKEGQTVGYLAFCSAYGYQSEIQMGVVVNHAGILQETLIMDENETPSFIVKINNAGFLENQFRGKAIEEGFNIETNINAVSGATISSNAITKAVQEACQTIGKNQLGIQVPSAAGIRFGISEWVLLGMMALALLALKFNNRALRYLTMSYSIILLGAVYKQFIAFSWIVSAVTAKVPNYTDNLGWYILIIGTILFIAFTGKNVYCAYICPFGALQQAENQLAGFSFFKVNAKVKKAVRILPATLAYIGFCVAILSGEISALSFEPFSLIYGRTGSGIQWALLPIVLIMALLTAGFYCHNACPVGFVLRQGVRIRKKIKEIIKRKNSHHDAVLIEKIGQAKSINKSKSLVMKTADLVFLAAVGATALISLMTIFSNI